MNKEINNLIKILVPVSSSDSVASVFVSVMVNLLLRDVF